KLPAEFRIIVDLTVQQYPGRLVFIGNRLVSAGNIDDAKPPMSQTDARGDINSFVVGTTVADGLSHTMDSFPRNCFPQLKVNDAAQPAHLRPYLGGRRLKTPILH